MDFERKVCKMCKTRTIKVRTIGSAIIIGMFILHVFSSAGWTDELVPWGSDLYGRISDTPAGNDFEVVSTGPYHNVAIKSDGSLIAWGLDDWGQVSNTPAGTGFRSVAAGGYHNVALKSDGTLVSWGRNSSAQISLTPTGNNFVAVAAGAYHSVALKSDGSIIAWGRNVEYQVSPTPAGNNFVAIAAGPYHNVALKSDGSLVAWGYDGQGQVSKTPASNDCVAIAAGSAHNVALKSDGSLVAWGYDGEGEVSNTPVGNNFIAIAAGYVHSVALKSDGSLIAWGYDGQGQVSNTPTGNDFIDVSTGYDHNIAIRGTQTIPTTYTLSTNVSPSGSGIVTKSPNQLSYNANESVQLTANASSGYIFSYWSGDVSSYSNPVTVIMNSNKTVTANFEAAVIKPTVSIAATDASAGEPSNNGSFAVSRTGDTSTNLLVYYNTSGTAASGTDYAALSGYVYILKGQSSASIPVSVIDDSAIENSETLQLTISSNATYTVGSPSSAAVTITDDDQLPTVMITATDSSAGEPFNDGSFTVNRTVAASTSLRVYYSTTGSTASSGSDYTALPGYVDIPAGQSSTTIYVDVINDSSVEDTETLRLTISSNATYTVGSASYATVTITDDDVEDPVDNPVVTITATDASAGEPSNYGYFMARRTGDISATLRIYYSTSGSTATSGADYSALTGYVDIPAGRYWALIYVIVLDDSAAEGSETVQLTISSNTAYTVGSPSSATVTIADDDSSQPEEAIVTVTATDASAGEPYNDGSFTVSRTGATTSNLLVYYSTTGSTASSGADYTALPGYVYIPAGYSSAVITVDVINDISTENSETVQLTISNNTAYTVGSPSSATVTITDDDQAVDTPVVTITATDSSAGEPANDGSFRVSRTGATSAYLRVYYSNSGSTAVSGADYAALPGYVDIPIGQSSATIIVDVINDSSTENSETVRLTISSNAAYTVGSPSYATVTITDDDVTSSPELVMAELLNFYNQSLDDGSLVTAGKGNKEVVIFTKMLDTADQLIKSGNYDGACTQLSDAYAGCDGSDPDYVQGTATVELRWWILQVMDELGCP